VSWQAQRDNDLISRSEKAVDLRSTRNDFLKNVRQNDLSGETSAQRGCGPFTRSSPHRAILRKTGAFAMTTDNRRAAHGRRSASDRRSGTDTRSDHEKTLHGERRSGVDRRTGVDRRGAKPRPEHAAGRD
jgi:hypothetical protein